MITYEEVQNLDLPPNQAGCCVICAITVVDDPQHIKALEISSKQYSQAAKEILDSGNALIKYNNKQYSNSDIDYSNIAGFTRNILHFEPTFRYF